MAGVHRATLKKKQKGFKSKHASKGAIKAANKGKIQKSSGNASRNGVHTLSKQDRKNIANQIKVHKQATAAERCKIFDGKNGVPRNVAIVPLTSDIDSLAVVNEFTTVLEGTADPSIPGTITVARFKQRLRFFIPEYTKFYDLLDSCRSADFVVFVLSASTEIDDYGEQVMRCICSQGVTTSIGLVWNLQGGELNQNTKKQAAVRTSLTSWYSHFFADEKLYSLASAAELQVAGRIISQRIPKGVNWRDDRPYVVAERVETGPDSPNSLVIHGRVRGAGLTANNSVHVPGVGDFRIDAISLAVTSHDMDIEQAPLEPGSSCDFGPDASLDRLIPAEDAVELTEVEDVVDGAGIRIDGHSYINEKMEAGMDDGPQTIKRLPKGVSEYQAAWLLEGVDYGFDNSDFDENDNGDEDMMSDEEGELVDQLPEAEDAMEEDSGTAAARDGEDEDEDDFDEDGLKKFREAQEDLEFPDEIELKPEQSAKERLSRYRGVRSLRHAVWDANERDARMPAIFTRLWRPGSLIAKHNQIVKDLMAGSTAPVGSSVTMVISGPADGLQKLVALSSRALETGKQAVTFYGLLPGEQKLGMVNMSISLDSEITEPIKSKDSLVVQIGPRRLNIRPLFSQAGHNDNGVYKFHRYLHPGRAATASIIAPITLGQVPVVYFTPSTADPHIVGTGSVLNADSNRVIVKTAVLTGYPVKIHRKLVTVRYMFFNRDDVQWFRAVPLFTKYGAQGFIKEPLGTHGYFKATFDKKIRANDTIAMAVYKRVWPIDNSVALN